MIAGGGNCNVAMCTTHAQQDTYLSAKYGVLSQSAFVVSVWLLVENDEHL